MAEQHDVAGILAGVSMFADLPASGSRAHGVVVSRCGAIPRGQVVFSTGDPSDSLLVVVSGRMKVLLRSADGGELMLAVVEAGAVIGELGVIDGGVRSADAETLEVTEVLVVPREVVLDLQSRLPEVAAGPPCRRGLRLPSADRRDRGSRVPRSAPTGRQGLARQPSRRTRRDRPRAESGAAGTPGCRDPTEREPCIARLRATGMDRGQRPADRAARAGRAGAILRRGSVGRMTVVLSATRRTDAAGSGRV